MSKDHNSLWVRAVTLWSLEHGSCIQVTILACNGEMWVATEVPDIMLTANGSIYHRKHTGRKHKNKQTIGWSQVANYTMLLLQSHILTLLSLLSLLQFLSKQSNMSSDTKTVTAPLYMVHYSHFSSHNLFRYDNSMTRVLPLSQRGQSQQTTLDMITNLSIY